MIAKKSESSLTYRRFWIGDVLNASWHDFAGDTSACLLECPPHCFLMKWFPCLLWLLLLLSACGGGGVAVNEPLGSESFRYNMPSGNVQDLRFGKEVWFSYGAVAGTAQTPANGLAKIHVFEKGSSMHTIQVNIALPKNGSFYECWLLDPKSGARISTGHLKSLFGDVRHNLDFKADSDLRTYKQVIITLEKDDGNPAPGMEVATATLKELKRD